MRVHKIAPKLSVCGFNILLYNLVVDKERKGLFVIVFEFENEKRIMFCGNFYHE